MLYKYTNLNLIAVVTEGIDYQKGKFRCLQIEDQDMRPSFFFSVPFVNIYLLDTVTGSLKLSHTHKRVKSPVHVVLAENWIVVSST